MQDIYISWWYRQKRPTGRTVDIGVLNLWSLFSSTIFCLCWFLHACKHGLVIKFLDRIILWFLIVYLLLEAVCFHLILVYFFFVFSGVVIAEDILNNYDHFEKHGIFAKLELSFVDNSVIVAFLTSYNKFFSHSQFLTYEY